ncbi:uncharacterized protein PAF06_002786 [Gastrophryne carolinensis]
MVKLKSCFLLICMLGISCMWLSASFYWSTKEQCNITSVLQDRITQTPNDTITPLEGDKVFIIAPYYDDRAGKAIRILAIVHHKEVEKLYCYFSCTVGELDLYISEAKIDIHSDRFDYPYGMTDIICDEPSDCQPRYVSVHETPIENVTRLTKFEIRNLDRGSFSANFTVCTSTIYGNFSNALQLMQTIEMYRLLGAQKVVIYLNNCSRQVEEILRFYKKEGIVELVLWPIHQYLKPSRRWRLADDPGTDIGYYGQMSVLNDCLYRNMYKSKFVVLCDIDEIILPFHHHTWDDMMETLESQNQGASIFLFENHVLPQTVVTDGNFSNVSMWKNIPGFNLLEHVHREPDRPHIFNPRKMILNPRTVTQTSVHSVLKGSGRSVYVSSEIALIHHCRSPWQPHLEKTSLINDQTIWRYNTSLIANVNRVIQQLTLAIESKRPCYKSGCPAV